MSMSAPNSGVRPTDFPSSTTSASVGIEVIRSLCDVAASTASTETDDDAAGAAMSPTPAAGCAVTAVLAWSIF